MAPVAPTSAVQHATSLLAQIGNTPLIRLAKLDAELPGVEIYAKAEFFNPGGSVKDRAGLNMILDGERTGRLTLRGRCRATRIVPDKGRASAVLYLDEKGREHRARARAVVVA